MISGFSFTANDYESILLNACNILPGIERITSVYYDPATDNLAAITLQNPDANKEIESLQILDGRNQILKSRTLKSSFDWISREDVPFTITSGKSSQANIFKEQENVVLLLRYSSPYDHFSDLIYIYLKKNFGNFGLGNASRVLSTENKQIIASLLYNSLKNLLTNIRNDKAVLKKLNGINRSLVGETEKLKSELASIKSGFSESIINLCRQTAGEISARISRQIRFSEDAIEKLKTFNGNIKSLHSIIWNSVEYANALRYDEQDDEILIKEQFLVFDDVDSQHIIAENVGHETEKYEKTIELLDKLETAAKTVISRNHKLTSTNVGRFCPQPISAPAITDALKKHRKKVVYLFEKYPGKWELLKREFKPVQNLIVTSSAEQKSA